MPISQYDLPRRGGSLYYLSNMWLGNMWLENMRLGNKDGRRSNTGTGMIKEPNMEM